MLWFLVLGAFYTLAQKSNLVASSIAGRRQPNKQILRSDVQLSSAGLLVTFCWTKTMQDGSRPLFVPCVAIPGAILCPFHALSNMLDQVPAPSHGAAFGLPHKQGVRAVTYKYFMLILRCSIGSLGLDPSKLSSRSFRHGGTTFAEGRRCKKELFYSKSHFSLHVKAKQRRHIMWFYKHKIELKYV